MKINAKDVRKKGLLSDKVVREYLAKLIEALDEQAGDYFGTEGWRHGLMNEDDEDD